MARAAQRDETEQRYEQRPDDILEGFTLHEDTGDRFHIDPAEIPDGVDYQWATFTIMGKVDSRSLAALAMNRWTPVPRERHPSWGTDGGLIDGQKGTRIGARDIVFEDCIIRDGMLLIERAKQISDYVRAHEKRKADEQVVNQMKRVRMAPEGTLAGVDRKRNVKVVRGRDLSIPEDAEA